MNKELQFSEWLENCTRDAHDKLELDWAVISLQLLVHAQHCLVTHLWEEADRTEEK